MKSSDEFKLLLGTRNAGKAAELRSLLSILPKLKIHSLLEFPELASVEETDSSYVENAIRKARFYAVETGMWAIADDSGLEVDALNGSPGVVSARYGGEEASDLNRIQLLLKALDQFGQSERRARFRSIVALANNSGEILHVAEGICEGTIGFEPRGTNGFGYDPIFIPSGYDRTFAELSTEEKDLISHRGNAFRHTKEFLLKYMAPLDRSGCAS